MIYHANVSICREHLSEKNAVNEDKIKSKSMIRSLHEANKERDSKCYLSEEELSLKKGLDESIRKFFEFDDAFIQTREREQIDTDDFNHLSRDALSNR